MIDILLYYNFSLFQLFGDSYTPHSQFESDAQITFKLAKNLKLNTRFLRISFQAWLLKLLLPVEIL